MASLGKLTNSLVSAVNENTLALASLNFDFSVIKVEAPAEYMAVGTALGSFRKENAEYGSTHRTARKLAALFDELVPSVPTLIAAYGKRSSEIMQTPGVNPSGTNEHHGAFSEFVGADATSIWAAATSGTTAIGVHLLACLLARSFGDPAISTSVWAEMVAVRQREVLDAAQNSTLNLAQVAAINAANQQISREELRRWDASARSWVQTADSARRRDYTQLKLILKNIDLPVTGGGRLYDDVIRAWRTTMVGLERLIKGEPQRVTDGAILLAISAWHLYPNLLVLGTQTTKVDFADPLMAAEGLLTIGITTMRDGMDSQTGIHWSVALSHYRYYGRPEKTTGEMEERLTIDELEFVALGSLLRTWNAPRGQIEPAARWFDSLWKCLERAKISLQPLQWLEILVRTSRQFLSASVTTKRSFSRLIDFGYRRGPNFLTRKSPKNYKGIPWFGLRSRNILKSLAAKNPEECAVSYFRYLATSAGLEHSQAFIYFISKIPGEKIERHTCYTAVVDNPSPLVETDDPLSEEDVPDLVQEAHGAGSPSQSRGKQTAHSHKQGIKRAHPPAPVYNTKWVGKFSIEDDLGFNRSTSTRDETEMILQPNMVPQPSVIPDLKAISDIKKTISRRLSTRIYPLGGKLRCEQFSANPDSMLCDCQATLNCGPSPFTSKRFTQAITDSLGIARLYITGFPDGGKERFEQCMACLRSGTWDDLVEIENAIPLLIDHGCDESCWLNPLLLWQYLGGPNPYDPDNTIKPVLELMNSERADIECIANSLKNLVLARKVYEKLDGATISPAIVDTGLHSVKWALKGDYLRYTISMAFSCIAMLETGTVNLDSEKLNEVFALSSGNSLFVSSRLLGDPHLRIDDNAITRITGNVGRSGISLLVPPAAKALVRPLSSNYRAVNYDFFDGNREDNFRGTTLHLSFTSHEFPLDYGALGTIDHQVFLVESVVSVYDAGQWVADLDVRKIFDNQSNYRVPTSSRKKCRHTSEVRMTAIEKFVTVDTWEEVLDVPPSLAIVRTHKNWPARLATSIILSRGNGAKSCELEESDTDSLNGALRASAVLENGDDVCWKCVHYRMQVLGTKDPRPYWYIIA